MTRTMYDSVNIHAIPANATMVAGYVDGLYANVGSLQRLFPAAVVVRIAVSSHTNDGHVLDVEQGDATAVQAVSWVKMRRNAGADPSVYCNTSVWPSVKKAFQDAGIPEPHYWVAQWDDNRAVPSGAVAKQYIGGGRGYDTSVVNDVWPGVDSHSNPRPIDKSVYYVVQSGDTLSGIAVKYGITLKQIEDLNVWITNPNVIRIGDKIRVSGKSSSPHTNALYKVQAGDTLSSIAAAYHLTLAQIEKLNPQIKNPNLIFPGQTIYL